MLVLLCLIESGLSMPSSFRFIFFLTQSKWITWQEKYSVHYLLFDSYKWSWLVRLLCNFFFRFFRVKSCYFDSDSYKGEEDCGWNPVAYHDVTHWSGPLSQWQFGASTPSPLSQMCYSTCNLVQFSKLQLELAHLNQWNLCRSWLIKSPLTQWAYCSVTYYAEQQYFSRYITNCSPFLLWQSSSTILPASRFLQNPQYL